MGGGSIIGMLVCARKGARLFGHNSVAGLFWVGVHGKFLGEESGASPPMVTQEPLPPPPPPGSLPPSILPAAQQQELRILAGAAIKVRLSLWTELGIEGRRGGVRLGPTHRGSGVPPHRGGGGPG